MSGARYRASLLAALGAVLIAGCTTTRPVPPAALPAPAARLAAPVLAEKGTATLPPPRVELRRCPNAAEIARLRDARPKPLRDQKMPATTSERVAKVAAQLGMYEAEGRWADQVERAFRKCEDR